MQIRTRRKIMMLVLPWLIWGVACMFYAHQYFMRVSVSSLSPNLVAHFHINAVTLGSVAAYFYFAFMVMQLLSGVLIDRFGPRIMLTFAALLCGLGGILFSLAPHVFDLSTSRVLMGASAAFSLIGVLTLARRWFSSPQFALINGLTLTVGTFGAFLGEGPLSRLLGISNWREVIFEAGVIGVVIAILIWLIVRDWPAGSEPPKQQGKSLGIMLRYLAEVVRKRHIWLIGLYAGLMFIPVNAFAALWCGTYLVSVYGVTLAKAELAASMVYVGVGVGAPLVAWFSNIIKNRMLTILLVSALATFLMVAIIYVPMPFFLMFASLLLLGIFVSGFSLAFVIVRESTESNIAATAFSFTNFLKLIFGAISLGVIGVLLSQHFGEGLPETYTIYSLSDFRFSLLIIPVCLMMAFLMGLVVRRMVSNLDSFEYIQK